MFDFVRKHTKVTMGLLFLLIVPSFVLLGFEGYSGNQEKGVTVAKVDRQNITQSEWDRAHQAEVDRLHASMPTLDPKILDSTEARYGTLEKLLRDRVIAVAAEKLRFTASDQRLAKELQQSPEISALRRPDGTLDMERYRQILREQGMTPELFEANVRADLSHRQVLAGVGATGLTSKGAADLALNAYFEKREVQSVVFQTADFMAQLNPSQADLERFYQAKQQNFQAPEQVDIEYLVLDLQAVSQGMTVNESDIKTFYEHNIQRFTVAEERRASHILLATPKTATAAEREKAKAKAQQLLLAARQAPDSFADLAQKNSQDPGSATNGGDLDFFARGSMVKPFEDAAFAMKTGQISDVVESDFGYHIIKLTDIKAAKQRSFEETRAQLEVELKKQQAQKKFAESAEIFSNGVYEQSDNLQAIAERLKLPLKTATTVVRQPPAGVQGVLANPKFLNALFSPDAIEKKRNTEAIEIAPQQWASGRVVKHLPARVQPFAEVKDAVRQRWLTEHALEAVRKQGLAKLNAWRAAPNSAAELTAPLVVARDQQQKLPIKMLEAALRADPQSLPAWVGVDLGEQGYGVVKINKVIARTAPPPETAQQQINQYGQSWGAAENLAYYNTLKNKLKASILAPKPAPTDTP